VRFDLYDNSKIVFILFLINATVLCGMWIEMLLDDFQLIHK
jgi:hypothetical protein